MTTTSKETHDLHVQSNISIITDGSRGVTLSQVISTADSNGASTGIPMSLQDKRYAIPANYQKVNLPDVKMIKPRESKPKDRNNHSHHYHHHHHRPQLAITDHSQAAKSHKPETKVKHAKSSSKDGSDKDKRHGKPSAVKSRSSKKSLVRSSKSSSSSKYSEPNPVLPVAQAQDLAELLLEKLSGTSISSKSASTLRLSSIHESLNDDTFKSQTDKSLFSEVSKDGTRKFTANDGRPLDKNEKPDVRVHFENSQQGRIGPVIEKSRPLTSAHAPLSTQLFVSKTYPSTFEKEPKQNEFFTKSVQTESNANVQFAVSCLTDDIKRKPWSNPNFVFSQTLQNQKHRPQLEEKGHRWMVDRILRLISIRLSFRSHPVEHKFPSHLANTMQI